MQDEAKRRVAGPRSLALMERKEAAVPRAIYTVADVFVDRSEGAQVVDVDGQEYIDFAGGIGVLNVGQRPARLVEALAAQLEKFVHTCFHVSPYEAYVEVAERLNEKMPGDHSCKTMLTNSGAEAVENAFKFARHATGKSDAVVFDGSFHGRTLLGMSLSSKVSPLKDGFGPFVPGVHRVPFANCYRCPIGSTYPECGLGCLEIFDRFFDQYASADSVAAVIVEPVQGEGGFIVPPVEWLQELRSLCTQRDLLLIADEVQTSFGRTGAFFAVERFGIEPDILTASKSIAGGLPLAATIGRSEIMDSPPPGACGSTFGGNPLSCVSALTVLDLIEEQRLPERAEQIGAALMTRMQGWEARFPEIGDVRGLGAMCAMEFVKDRGTKEPYPEVVPRILAEARARGLILMGAGTYSNVIRFLMPLVIPLELLERGLDILEESLATSLE